MNPVFFMDSIFWLLVATTALLWLAYWLSAKSSHTASTLRRRTRWLLVGYASVSALILCSAVWYFAGWSALGSTRTMPQALRRTIQHMGYYLAAGQAFTFGGPAVQNAFHHPSLRGGEYFTLAPAAPTQASVGGNVQSWTLSWSPMMQPLRVNGAVVNVTDPLWMQPGDFVRICDASSAPDCAQFTYDKTVLRDGHDQYTLAWKGKSLPIRFTLARGMSLADLVRTERNWPADFPLLPDSFWEAFSGITWVRELSGDLKSRMGLLVDPGQWSGHGVVVYKNANAIQEASGAGAATKQISTSSTITCGLIHPLQLDLHNSNRAQVSLNGHSRGIVELRFQRPVVWPLPPNDAHGHYSFLLTSTDDHIPMDGYSFDLPDPAKPFYAKAEIQGGELDQWKITSQETDSSADEVVRLGRPSQGVLLRLTRARAAWPGSAGMLAIAISTLMFVLAVLIDRRQPLTYRLNCIWATVWVLALALLTFRFLTAFRMSLLPPVDASPRDLIIFNKTLSIALGALLLIPSAMALAWVAGARGLWDKMRRLRTSLAGSSGAFGNDPPPFGSRRPYWSLALLGLPSVWVVVGTLLGQQQSFLHLRINIAVHLLTILILWVFCERMPASANWRALLGLAIIVPMALQVALLRDRGDLLYAPPLLAVVFLLWFWDKPERTKTGAAGWVLATALALLPLAAVFTLIFKSGDNVVQYRWASATGADDQVLLSTDDQRFDFDHYRRTMLQRWQMLAYAAQGASAPWGYGHMPLSNVGMSYASSMSDSGFAIYVLGEHGPILAALVAAFLVGIGSVLWLAVPWFSGTRASPREGIGLVLIAIGGYFVVNTVYMALANLGLRWTPFTGQNVPLLSFDSAGDALQAGILLVLASFLLATERAPRTRADLPVFLIKSRFWPLRRRMGWVPVLGLLLFAGTVLLGVFLVRLQLLSKDPTAYVVDHNLDKKVLESIRSHLPEDSKSDENPNTALKLTQDGRLTATDLVPLSVSERRLIEDFNLRPDKFDPQQGYLYLVSTPDGPRVHINENYFRVALPFAQHADWRGTMLAAGMNEDMPTICGLNSTAGVAAYCLGLSEQGAGKTTEQCFNYQQTTSKSVQTDVPALADLQTPRTRLSSSYILCLDNHGNSLFSLRRQGNDLLMTPDQTGIRILVDGAPHKPSVPLPPQSVIDVITPKDPEGYQNLIYLGTQHDAIAFSQWRNGKRRRVFPHGPEFPMAYALGKAADQTLHSGTDLHLALDLQLQDDLLSDFHEFIKRNADYETPDPMGKRLAVVVLDAFSGEIKAMPSWPYANPAQADFEHELGLAGPREQERMLKNHNLDDHVVGSTIKPLVFSSVASALWPVADVGQLEVTDKADASTSNGLPGHYHWQIAGIPLDGSWNCNSHRDATINSHDFLVHSLDFYEEVLGMVGAVADKRAWESMLSAQSNSRATPVQYKGRFYLDIGQIRKGPYPHSLFTLDDFDSPGRHPHPSSAYRADTLLSRGMRDVFDAPGFGSSAPREPAEMLQTAANLLPSLTVSSDPGDKHSFAVVYANVVPDAITVSPFENVYPSYVLCLLGGGPSCRFNNIWMAQSAARIASRQRVTATLEKRTQQHPFDDLPTPLGRRERPDWVPEHLIRPLQEVGLKGGTAERLASLNIPSRCSRLTDSDCYMILYKTGTIDEDKEDKEESEALLFVVGLWRQGAFVPGSTLAGFLYMQDSKIKNVHGCPAGLDCRFKKFEFAGPIVQHVAGYLREQIRLAGVQSLTDAGKLPPRLQKGSAAKKR